MPKREDLDGYAIAVIIPCYNERQTIGKVIDDLRLALPLASIYVYDNASSDGTAAEASKHGAVVVREPRRGKGNVVRSMFRDIDADCYLMVDGDDTYPAEAAPALVESVLIDGNDMAVGDRITNGSYTEENSRAFHGFGNSLVRSTVSHLYGMRYEDVMTGYRCVSRAYAKTMPVMSTGFQIETEMSIHAADHNMRVSEIPIDYRDRPAGSSSKLDTVPDGIRVLRTIGAQFKDKRPLRFFSLLALLLVLLGVAAGIPVISDYMATGLVPKLPSAVLAVGLVTIGVLSMLTGIILDTIAKNERMRFENEWMRELEREQATPLNGCTKLSAPFSGRYRMPDTD